MKKKYKTTFPVVSNSSHCFRSFISFSLMDHLSYIVLQLQARIKKIMQMDEDVGKVAQATPVLICTFPLQFTFASGHRGRLNLFNFIHVYNSDKFPTRIAKALELFLQSLIDNACEETRARNGKKLSVAHLKRTIITTDQFDFLKDVVEGVPDPSDLMGPNAVDEGKAIGGSNGGNSSDGIYSLALGVVQPSYGGDDTLLVQLWTD
ncbi:hypothetical protein BC937DRAFT_94312 [Endogone sp. FLAS-F59071]|nr:hypothetical protein BC937DRAFT_94312 [Endogone sp. FLAS-F59071]|eukprot:RUS22966.1 hypothetical protein BC937DRAFT_94312 [Endogone sp. FLAS-F59071]